MYMQAQGLGRYRFRRGLGDGIAPGTLNCPGDPGCPGYQMPPDVFTCADGSPVPASGVCSLATGGAAFTSLLNQNVKAIAIGAGALFLFALAVKR